jgi:hypothetical protein
MQNCMLYFIYKDPCCEMTTIPRGGGNKTGAATVGQIKPVTAMFVCSVVIPHA